jgi:hypothetical protein
MYFDLPGSAIPILVAIDSFNILKYSFLKFDYLKGSYLSRKVGGTIPQTS